MHLTFDFISTVRVSNKCSSLLQSIFTGPISRDNWVQMVSVAWLLKTERTFGFAVFQCSFIVFRVLMVAFVVVASNGGGGRRPLELPGGGGGGGGIIKVGGGGGVGTVVSGTECKSGRRLSAESPSDTKSLKSKSRIFSWCIWFTCNEIWFQRLSVSEWVSVARCSGCSTAVCREAGTRPSLARVICSVNCVTAASSELSASKPFLISLAAPSVTSPRPNGVEMHVRTFNTGSVSAGESTDDTFSHSLLPTSCEPASPGVCTARSVALGWLDDSAPKHHVAKQQFE